MPKFSIHHITQYQYTEYAQYSANRMLLYPIRDAYQEVVFHQLNITNHPFVEIHRDYYGNEVGTFTLIEPHLTLTIDSKLEVVTRKKEDPTIITGIEEQWAILRSDAIKNQYNDFLSVGKYSKEKEIQNTFGSLFDESASPLENTLSLNRYVYEQFNYVKGVTTVESTIDEIWQQKSGVCQDFALVLLEFLRMAHIPSRYVSGYICPHQTLMRGEGATHAWVEVYLPDYGWLGIDPTNNCIAAETHVRLAVGRHFGDCSPVKGTYRGSAEHSLYVMVSVAYEDGMNKEENGDVQRFKSDKEIEQNYIQSQQQQ